MSKNCFFCRDRIAEKQGVEYRFQYLRTQSQLSPAFFSIYVVIRSFDVIFYYSNSAHTKDTVLIHLPFSDHHNPKGELSTKLKMLWSSTFKVSGLSENHLLPLSGSYYSNLSIFEGPDEVEKSFKLRTLFLDFLYELFQANTFRDSPHFSHLMKIVRENFFFRAILLKSEYYYQKALWETLPITTYQIAQKQYQTAKESWLDLLVSENSPTFLSNTGWFAQNTEKEADFVCGLAPKEEKVDKADLAITVQMDKTLIDRMSDWYLRRYNFKNSSKLILVSNPAHKYIAYFPLIFIIGYVGMYNLYNPDVYEGFKIVIAYILLLMLLCLGGAWLYTQKEISLLPQSNTLVSISTLINFWSPRLIITLFITWFSYHKLGQTADISVSQALLYYVIAGLVIPMYLSKEIRAEAPDLSKNVVRKRVFDICIRAFFITLLIGLVTLHILGDAKKLSLQAESSAVPLIIKNYYSLLNFITTLFAHAGFIFFTGLFVNLIFKGKRFTGF